MTADREYLTVEECEYLAELLDAGWTIPASRVRRILDAATDHARAREAREEADADELARLEKLEATGQEDW